ncbi:MAG: methyltransferase domain-containing protein [Pseudomonadota bacterium]
MDTQRDDDDAGAAWDARYRADDAPFGTGPSATLSALFERSGLSAALSKGGRALCLADGDGRNGRWLAGRGFTVTAVDVSALATQQAVGRDSIAGVSVARITADLGQWRAEDSAFALVTLQFLQGPWPLRRAALTTAGAALAPGGLLLLEGFAAREGVRDPDETLGPSRDTHRWRQSEIDTVLPDLQALSDHTAKLSLGDGPRHTGRGLVLSALRRRPG